MPHQSRAPARRRRALLVALAIVAALLVAMLSIGPIAGSVARSRAEEMGVALTIRSTHLGFFMVRLSGVGVTSKELPGVSAELAEVEVFPTLAANRNNHEAIAEDEGLGLSPLDLSSKRLIPSVYGGDGEINEVGDPNDGLGGSAQALTLFIHRHAVWGNGPRAPGSARSGSTPGASTLAVSRADGVDWAYVINTRDWPPSTSPTLDDLSNAITHILDTTPIA